MSDTDDKKEVSVSVNRIEIDCITVLIWIMTFIMAIGNFANWWVIPWVWVFCPIWLPFTLLALVLAGVFGLIVGALLIAGLVMLWETTLGWFK